MDVNELLRWENEHEVLRFKFQHDNTLVWPLIRCTVFNKVIENSAQLQVPHAPGEKLSLWDKFRYLFQTIIHQPFSIEKNFDILCFSSTAGISLKKDDQWFGRISDYFVLEENERTLVLDESYRRKYKFPRAPSNVRCHDFIQLNAILRGQILGKMNQQDLMTIKELIDFLKENFKGQLKQEDYGPIEHILKVFSMRLAVLHQSYLRLFAQVKPRLLMMETASYGGVNAWIIKWAHDCGIVSCEPQHGCISIPYMYSERLIQDQEYQKYLPDHLLLYGRYWAGLVRSPSQKVIIGNPHFDTKKLEFKKEKEGSRIKKILIVSQGTVTNILVDLTCQLSKLIEGMDYEITYRLHRGEVPFVERYQQLKGLSNVQLDQDQDIYRLIDDSDYIVGSYSLTLFEALGLGKKIYVLEGNRSSEYIPKDLGLRFKNAMDLFELIKKDQGHQSNDTKEFWAEHWQENYHQFINSVMGTQGAL